MVELHVYVFRYTGIAQIIFQPACANTTCCRLVSAQVQPVRAIVITYCPGAIIVTLVLVFGRIVQEPLRLWFHRSASVAADKLVFTSWHRSLWRAGLLAGFPSRQPRAGIWLMIHWTLVRACINICFKVTSTYTCECVCAVEGYVGFECPGTESTTPFVGNWMLSLYVHHHNCVNPYCSLSLTTQLSQRYFARLTQMRPAMLAPVYYPV